MFTRRTSDWLRVRAGRIASLAAAVTLSATALTGCASQTTAGDASSGSQSQPAAPAATSPSAPEPSASASPAEGSAGASGQTTPLISASTAQSDTAGGSASSAAAEAFFQATKDYILNDQQNLPSAEQLHWLPSFLDEVDMPAMYQQYLKAGGQPQSTEAFASFLTANNPPPGNWQQLITQALASQYHVTANRFEPLSGYPGYYLVYVDEYPDQSYVTASARTGYWHG